MDTILYFFRDKIVSVPYFIYSFVILILIFSIIGYLFKQKYAKVEIKLALTKQQNDPKEQVQTEIPIDKKAAKKLAKLKAEDEKIKSLKSNNSNISSKSVSQAQIKEDKKAFQTQNLNTQVHSLNNTIKENTNLKEISQVNNQSIINQNVQQPQNASSNIGINDLNVTNLSNNVEQKIPSTNIAQPQSITLNTKIESSIPEIK